MENAGAAGLSHDFVVNQSQGKLLLGFSGSLACTLAGFVMLRGTGVSIQIGGLATLIFASIAALLFAWRVGRTEAVVLIFGDAGLTDYRIAPAPVPWADIQAARFHTIYGSHFIELDLAHPERYPARGLARLNHMTGWSPTIVYLGFLDRPAQEIVLAFEGYWDEHRDAAIAHNLDQPDPAQMLPCSSTGGVSSGP